MKNYHQSLFKGFSLIELMVIIAIVGILAALATPSYLQYMANSNGATLASQLLAAIRLAKNEALYRGMQVEICALASNSATPTASAPGTCATSGSSWQYGWQVYYVDASGYTQLVYFAQPPNASAISTSVYAIGFLPSGIPCQPNTATPPICTPGTITPSNTTFTVKPSGCSYGYQVTVSATGGNSGIQLQGGSAGAITCP